MVVQSMVQNLITFEAWKCLNCGNMITKREKTIEFDAFSLFYQQQKTKRRS